MLLAAAPGNAAMVEMHKIPLLAWHAGGQF
jgi:hypothetical protein